MLSKAQRRRNNFATGARAENQALHFLENRNYSILERNLQINKFEIDLIAFDQKRKEVVFVEVKARKNKQFGDPSQAVNWRKRQKLQLAAKLYLRFHNWQKPYRFDIITVIGGQKASQGEENTPLIAHYQNISW